jgi:hypothetical protein
MTQGKTQHGDEWKALGPEDMSQHLRGVAGSLAGWFSRACTHARHRHKGYRDTPQYSAADRDPRKL